MSSLSFLNQWIQFILYHLTTKLLYSVVVFVFIISIVNVIFLILARQKGTWTFVFPKTSKSAVANHSKNANFLTELKLFPLYNYLQILIFCRLHAFLNILVILLTASYILFLLLGNLYYLLSLLLFMVIIIFLSYLLY